VFDQCNYSSLPFPLGPHSSLLFHVKHFLQKKVFLSGKVAEFSVKIPKYYLGQLQNVREKPGMKQGFLKLIVCEGAFI